MEMSSYKDFQNTRGSSFEEKLNTKLTGVNVGWDEKIFNLSWRDLILT